MHFAYWRNDDAVQLMPWVMEDWKKFYDNGGTIDDFILQLGFTHQWDHNRQSNVDDPIIAAVYTHDGVNSIQMGAGCYCRFVVLWQNPEIFGLLFAATPFDMFAIVREIHDYEKHMAGTAEYRYSSK